MRITLPSSSSQFRSDEVVVIEKSMTDNHPDNQKLEKKNGHEDDVFSPTHYKRRLPMYYFSVASRQWR